MDPQHQALEVLMHLPFIMLVILLIIGVVIGWLTLGIAGAFLIRLMSYGEKEPTDKEVHDLIAMGLVAFILSLCFLFYAVVLVIPLRAAVRWIKGTQPIKSITVD
jgi:uncharacterized protein YqhQ